MTRLLKTLPLLALASALFAAPSTAQDAGEPVREVRIAILDPATGDELAALAPNDVLQIAPGEERLLRLFEPQGSRGQVRRYLPGTYGFGNERTPLELVREDRARGEVVVRFPHGSPNADAERLHVGYRLGDRVRLADESLRLGRLRVDTVDQRAIDRLDPGAVRYAEEAVIELYRGILLRDPDPAAASYRQRIERGGQRELQRIAIEIANSREARYDVPQRGSESQRLAALYEHLLGRRSSVVDRAQWNEYADRIARGDLAGVVREMVSSVDFEHHFGYR